MKLKKRKYAKRLEKRKNEIFEKQKIFEIFKILQRNKELKGFEKQKILKKLVRFIRR